MNFFRFLQRLKNKKDKLKERLIDDPEIYELLLRGMFLSVSWALSYISCVGELSFQYWRSTAV